MQCFAIALKPYEIDNLIGSCWWGMVVGTPLQNPQIIRNEFHWQVDQFGPEIR